MASRKENYMIAIIDYDAGNIKSVEKAIQYLGEEAVVTRDRETILSADGVILPGVGAFGDAMGKLHAYGLVDVIHECVKREIPFLGAGCQYLPTAGRQGICHRFRWW